MHYKTVERSFSRAQDGTVPESRTGRPSAERSQNQDGTAKGTDPDVLKVCSESRMNLLIGEPAPAPDWFCSVPLTNLLGDTLSHSVMQLQAIMNAAGTAKPKPKPKIVKNQAKSAKAGKENAQLADKARKPGTNTQGPL